MILEPARDLYGAEADVSHLADYLELLALAEQPMTASDLADYLRDTTWTVRSRELYVGGIAEPTEDDEDGGSEISPNEQGAADVFALLESREALLGNRYPFDVHSHPRTVTARARKEDHRPYLALLAITVAHHYGVPVANVKIEDAFEGLVFSVLESRGLHTCDLGATWRANRDFRETVRQAGAAVRVQADPFSTTSRRHANDEGVDTIAHLGWGDLRPGHWMFIGQATIGASGTWRRKISQPRPEQWRRLLGSAIDPLAFLAVPHHVEDHQLHDLVINDKRMVLDRVRLAANLSAVSDDLELVTAAVLSAQPFDPRT